MIVLKFKNGKVRLEEHNMEISEGIKSGAYNAQGLAYGAKSKDFVYPSKAMFIKQLQPLLENEFKHLVGEIEIWSEANFTTGYKTIHLEFKYRHPIRKGKKK